MIELVQKIANFKIEEEEFESRRCPFTEARIGHRQFFPDFSAVVVKISFFDFDRIVVETIQGEGREDLSLKLQL